MPDEEEWLEWAAHNLALGVADQKVAAELRRNKVGGGNPTRILDEIRQSPIFRAARRIGDDVRKWIALNEVLLDLESQVHDFGDVPRVSNLSSADFHRDYYSTNRPVIIEDVVRDWPAVSKWSLGFLRRHLGHEKVTYQSGRSNDDHRDSFVDHSVTASFREYLDLIERNVASNNYYLIAHDRLLDRKRFKILLKDIILDSRYFDAKDIHGRVFFWLGPAGSRTPMHRDLSNVFFAQIKGRKVVKLIPSKQMHLVYNETGYHSEVDFNNYSVQKFPLLKNANICEVTVHPGELLFIPVGWWHFVRSLDTSITITGNNFKFDNALKPIF